MKALRGRDERLGERTGDLASDDGKMLAEVVPPHPAVVAGTVDQVGFEENPIADLEVHHGVAHGVDDAGGLVPGHDRQVDERMVATHRVQIRAADAHHVGAHAQLVRRGSRQRRISKLESAGGAQDDFTHSALSSGSVGWCASRGACRRSSGIMLI